MISGRRFFRSRRPWLPRAGLRESGGSCSGSSAPVRIGRVVSGFGGLGVPGAGLLELGRVQPGEHPRELVLGIDVPRLGGLCKPGAGPERIRWVKLAGEQDPEVVLGGDDPGFGGLGVPGACLGELRRVKQVESSTPRLICAGVPRSAARRVAATAIGILPRSMAVTPMRNAPSSVTRSRKDCHVRSATGLVRSLSWPSSAATR